MIHPRVVMLSSTLSVMLLPVVSTSRKAEEFLLDDPWSINLTTTMLVGMFFPSRDLARDPLTSGAATERRGVAAIDPHTSIFDRVNRVRCDHADAKMRFSHAFRQS